MMIPFVFLCLVALSLSAVSFSVSTPSSPSSPLVFTTPRLHSLWHSPLPLLSSSSSSPHVNLTFHLTLPESQNHQISTLFHSITNPQSENYQNYLSQQEVLDLYRPSESTLNSMNNYLESLSLPNSNSLILRSEWSTLGDSLTVTMTAETFSTLYHSQIFSYSHTQYGPSVTSLVSAITSDELRNQISMADGMSDVVWYVSGVVEFPLVRRQGGQEKKWWSNMKEREVIKENKISPPSPSVSPTSPPSPIHYVKPSTYSLFSSTPTGEEEYFQVIGNDGSLSVYGFILCPDNTPSTTAGCGYSMGCGSWQFNTATLEVRLANSNSPWFLPPVSNTKYFVSQQDNVVGFLGASVNNYIGYNLRANYSWTCNDNGQTYVFPAMYNYQARATAAMTPSFLKSFYGVPSTMYAQFPNSTQSIGALYLSYANEGFYNTKDLRLAQQQAGIGQDSVNCVNFYPDDASIGNNEDNEDGETELDVTQMIGLSPYIPTIVSYTNSNASPFINVMNNLLLMNDSFLPTVVSFSYGIAESQVSTSQMTATDKLFIAAGLRGLGVFVSSGDEGAFNSRLNECQQFTPDWPSSSPYVTAVGATQLKANAVGGTPFEIVCSNDQGALITSGGGFSNDYTDSSKFSWQTPHTTKYLNSPGNCNLPPSYQFNLKGRAYPDISLQGHAYPIFSGGQSQLVDGTSASSPSLAAMISLINDNRRAMGLKSLGFINPLIYSLKTSNPNAFNNVQGGSNACLEGGTCCSFGYSVCNDFTTFNPAIGLGTPNMAVLIPLLLNNKPLPQGQQLTSSTCRVNLPINGRSYGGGNDNNNTENIVIIVVVLGVALFIAFNVMVVWLCRRRSRANKQMKENQQRLIGQQGRQGQQQQQQQPISYVQQPQYAPPQARYVPPASASPGNIQGGQGQWQGQSRPVFDANGRIQGYVRT